MIIFVCAANKTQEVAGFNFDKLQELHPDQSEQLDKFQNHLASVRGQKSEFEALKAWQVQELGLQASHFATLQGNLIDSILDVSGNFPSKAASLSSVRVPSSFRQTVSYNQRLLANHFNLEDGEGAFFLQGSFIDPDSLDMFSFMDTLKSEIDLIEILKSVYHEKHITRPKLDAILSLGSKSADPDLALDLRDSSIYWINDLERDEEYEDWPDDLTQLFFRMGGVMLRPVRRNVFNLVLTLDPDDVHNAASKLHSSISSLHLIEVLLNVLFFFRYAQNGPIIYAA